MQIELLEVFRVVTRLGSITGAAQALGYTQSAVSRQIAALEAKVGARLLDRSPRGVALTEEGRCLLPHAEAMLDRLVTARRDLDALHGLGGGRLRVGAFPTAVAALVPRAMAAFHHAHPAVTLALVEGWTPLLLERLLSGDADVAVVSAPPDRPLDASTRRVYAATAAGRSRPPAADRFVANLDAEAADLDHGGPRRRAAATRGAR